MNKIFLLLVILLSSTLFCCAEIIQDEFALELPKDIISAEKHLDYNYESTMKIPFNLKIIEPIKSESKIYEGQEIKFKAVKDLRYNNRTIIRRGTIVPAKVSVIITPGMNGIPASIILTDFKIEGVSSGQITNTYEVFGQDRSLLVFPLKWALTILPPTGSLTNFIMGGHAKIKAKKQITLYYYPEWK